MVTRTVLLVDGDEDSRVIYSTMFRHLGYVVLQATRGDEALRLAEESAPDAVVTEIFLAGLDGYELCRRLREDERTQPILVVALTARAFEEDRLRALHTGFQDFLTKPIPPRLVVETVDRLLGAGRTS